MSISDVSDNQFQSEVLDADGAVLVDFWAPWCGPCKAVAPALEAIDQERDDVRIVKLNIDENQETAARFGVMSIPTMIVFQDGAIVGQVIGAQPKENINQALDSALG